MMLGRRIKYVHEILGSAAGRIVELARSTRIGDPLGFPLHRRHYSVLEQFLDRGAVPGVARIRDVDMAKACQSSESAMTRNKVNVVGAMPRYAIGRWAKFDANLCCRMRCYLSAPVAFVALTAILGMAANAHGQWSVTNLHPAGTTGSYALAASGARQAGYVTVGNQPHASLWSGTAASWVDLNPSGANYSIIFAASDSQQAGVVHAGGQEHAAIWSGTAASWVDLNPSGAASSWAYATSGSQQAGYATVGSMRRASVWSGTAASWVDLNPLGSSDSYINAITGSQQVGIAQVGGIYRASLWSGSAVSWVDLNPAGSTVSQAIGVGGIQQVGHARVGEIRRASLWIGTAESWVDLSPPGATDSFATSTTGSQQVGAATIDGVRRASLWCGTAASWVDLSAFLPVGFSESSAEEIVADGTVTYVSGYGYDTQAGRTEALLWTLPSAIWIGSYDASLGTLPQTQGWTFISPHPGCGTCSPPPPAIIDNSLRLFGVEADSQYFDHALSSTDFVNNQAGLVFECTARVTSAGYEPFSDSWRTGIFLTAFDANRHSVTLGLSETGIRLATDPNLTTANSSGLIPYDTTQAFHTYTISINSGFASLSVDGALQATVPLGPVGVGIPQNTLRFGTAFYGGSKDVLFTRVRWGGFGLPFATASPIDNAIFTGTRTDPGVSGPPTTFTFNSLTLQPGSNFTLGSNETLNLNNGLGTLYVQPGAIFCGNGVVIGNVVNAGLTKIPITRAALVNNITSPPDGPRGTVVIMLPGPRPTTPQPPIVLPFPPPPVINPGVHVVIGGPGFAGTNGGSEWNGLFPGHWPGWIQYDCVVSNGSLSWDGRLDVTGFFDQTSTGVLRMYIAGTVQGETYSYLHVGTTANIEGKLQIVLQPELFHFLARAGDSFDLVTSVSGLTLGPVFNVQTLMTAQGAAYLGLSLPPFDSEFAGDLDQLVSIPQNLFSYSVVNGGTTLRVTMSQSISCRVPAAPASGLTCPMGEADFALSPFGSAPASYQWQYIGAFGQPPLTWTDLAEGLNVIDGDCNLSVTGAQTPSIHIARVPATWPISGIGAGGMFRCVLTNTCGAVASGAASLSVCRADVNCSNDISVQDIFDFLAAYFAAGLGADFNASGTISVQDIFDFLAAYFAGCD